MTSAYRSGNGPNLVPCAGCGTFIDPTTALYSNQGELVCRPCHTKGEISAATVRGNAGVSYDRTYLRVGIVVALILLRVLIRFALH